MSQGLFHTYYTDAKFWRFCPTMSLACKDPKALGMESGKIPDSRITASSEWQSDYGASNARLNFKNYSGSWSSRQNNVNQWLQVDFEYAATITDILTQGRDTAYNQWVKSYMVSYSNDGVKFETYQSGGRDKVWKSYQGSKQLGANLLTL